MSEIHAAGVGAVLGDAGPPVTFDWSGRTYTLDFPAQHAKAALEAIVLEQAEDDYQRYAAMGPKFAARAAELDARIWARQWATWGSLWVASAGGPDGDAMFLLSLLKRHQPDVTLDAARVLWNAQPRPLRLALARVLPDFFTLLAAARPGATPEDAARAAAAMLERLGTPEPDPPARPPDSPAAPTA